MALGDGLLALLVLGFWLFCLFDVITTDESQMRNLSKLWWVVIVLLFVVVGSIMWLVAGRPQGAGAPRLPYKGDRGTAPAAAGTSSWAPGLEPARRAVAPDDDPEFLDTCAGTPPRTRTCSAAGRTTCAPRGGAARHGAPTTTPPSR